MTTIDEQVHLERYDPVWPQRFQTEGDRICVAFGWEASAVEHIGKQRGFGSPREAHRRPHARILPNALFFR